MFSWRITKYNPEYRDENGRYIKDDWIMISDIRESFDGRVLTVEEYLRVEDLYIDTVHDFLKCNNIDKLKIDSLKIGKTGKHKIKLNREIKRILRTLKNNNEVGSLDLPNIIRMNLRNIIWCKLLYKDIMYVHFGWDFYMYIGSKNRCNYTIESIEKRGLFAEEFISPY